MKKFPEVGISVNAQDCSGIIGSGPLGRHVTAEQLEAIAQTFLCAAAALRKRHHGTINCQNNLASIGIDFGGPFDEEKGLPVIGKIKISKNRSTAARGTNHQSAVTGHGTRSTLRNSGQADHE